MATFYQDRTLHKNRNPSISNVPSDFMQVQKGYIEKLTVAQNIFHRIKNYSSELEILVLGIIKIYCGPEFSERGRIDFLLQSIQNEIRDFEHRMKSSSTDTVVSERQTSPKNRFNLSPTMNDSLLSSTRSNNATMLAIRNDVKGLINEYKEAVGKLKAENKTIHSLVNERRKLSHVEGEFFSNRDERERKSKRTNASIDYQSNQQSPQRIFSDKSYNTNGSVLGGEEIKRLEKYAELDNYIDELNRKKEENLQRLATVENKLYTMRRKDPEDDAGALKTSDLSRDDEKPRSQKRREILKENNLNVPVISERKPSRSKREGNINSNYIDYLKRVDRENKKENRFAEKENSVRSGHKQLRQQQQQREHTNETRNNSNILEDEIDDLNKEIDMIKGLLDSAMLQRKYQNK